MLSKIESTPHMNLWQSCFVNFYQLLSTVAKYRSMQCWKWSGKLWKHRESQKQEQLCGSD